MSRLSAQVERFAGLHGRTASLMAVCVGLLLTGAVLLGQTGPAGRPRSTAPLYERTQWLKLDWTNATVVACGAVLSCNVQVGVLPARAKVKYALIRTTGAAVGPTTVTASAGRTAAAYIDYVLASNAKATATYGDSVTELGTGMQTVAGDIPSMTATTTVNAQFVSTGANLDTVTGSTGEVRVAYELIP